MGSIFVLEDTWHYWFHRGLHYGVFYKYIHKQHHRYAAPFGLAAEYAHPVEVALLGLGTVGIPIVWCLITGNLHLFTVSIWIILRLFQAVDAHSGYEFPWSLHNFLPFWAGADHHDEHHHYFIGGYSSSFRWWDFILDTEAGPKAKRVEKTKSNKMLKNYKRRTYRERKSICVQLLNVCTTFNINTVYFWFYLIYIYLYLFIVLHYSYKHLCVYHTLIQFKLI